MQLDRGKKLHTVIRAKEAKDEGGYGEEEGGGFRMGNTCIPVADSF